LQGQTQGNWPHQGTIISGEELRETDGARTTARKVIEDRILIHKLMSSVSMMWCMVAYGKDLAMVREYWGNLHDSLVAAARKDLGLKD
jgi:hypothetical protein